MINLQEFNEALGLTKTATPKLKDIVGAMKKRAIGRQGSVFSGHDNDTLRSHIMGKTPMSAIRRSSTNESILKGEKWMAEHRSGRQPSREFIQDLLKEQRARRPYRQPMSKETANLVQLLPF